MAQVKLDPKLTQAMKEVEAARAALKKSLEAGTAALKKVGRSTDDLDKSAGK